MRSLGGGGRSVGPSGRPSRSRGRSTIASTRASGAAGKSTPASIAAPMSSLPGVLSIGTSKPTAGPSIGATGGVSGPGPASPGTDASSRCFRSIHPADSTVPACKIPRVVFKLTRFTSKPSAEPDAAPVPRRWQHWRESVRRSSVLLESSGAGGGARIPVNVGWMKRLRGSLAAWRLCDRCPAAVSAIGRPGGF